MLGASRVVGCGSVPELNHVITVASAAMPDVDNLADLREAARLGLGRLTSELLRDVDLWAGVPPPGVPLTTAPPVTTQAGSR